MNLMIWGLVVDIIGVSILVLTSIINPYHGKYNFPFWRKRYFWIGWRPFYKNTETKKWIIKWNHKATISGWIPPKHKLEITGLFLILLGFILQLSCYIQS